MQNRLLFSLLIFSLLMHSFSVFSQTKPTIADCKKVLGEISKAVSAEAKEEIFIKFKDASNGDNQPFIVTTLNMMRTSVAQALAVEGKEERISSYLKEMKDDANKRDVWMLCASKSYENQRFEQAIPLFEQAVMLTLALNEGIDLNEAEKKKYPLIFGLYADALVKTGRVASAAPYSRIANRYDTDDSFFVKFSYVASLMYEGNTTDVLPLLENFVRKGLSGAEHEWYLKGVYESCGKTAEESVLLIEKLKKESACELQTKLKNSLTDIPAPDFTLKNMDGKTVSLSSLRGKVVVLDFWATWCGPCKASFPAMQKALDKYKNNPDVVFLFINTLDTRKDLYNAVKSYMAENSYSFNVLFDEREGNSKNFKAFSIFKGQGIPVKYVIDKAGKIRMQLTGFSGSDEQSVDELSQIIDMFL